MGVSLFFININKIYWIKYPISTTNYPNMNINLNFINTEDLYFSYLQAGYYYSAGKGDKEQNGIISGPELPNISLKRGKESPLYPYWRIAMRELQHIIAPWCDGFAWKNEYTEVDINIKISGDILANQSDLVAENLTGLMDMYLWESILYSAKIRNDDSHVVETKVCLLEWLCTLEYRGKARG